MNSDGSSFLNVESDDLMAAMRGSSIPADDFGPSAGAANDFGGENSGIITYDDLKTFRS